MIELIRIGSIGLALVIVGFLIGFFYRKYIIDSKLNSAEQKAKIILNDVEKEAQTIKKEALLEGKEEIQNLKAKADEEIKGQRAELQKMENRVVCKEEAMEKKAHFLEKKEKSLNIREKEIQKKDESLTEVLKKEVLRLEAIGELTKEEARAVLMRKMEDEARFEASKEIRKIEAKLKEDADKMAKKIISQAIQRCAIDHVSESTVSVVNLPNDEMKGRIIGREGRNIRVFENLTGINIIVDDTPEAVILSSFDPVRREIARVTLEN
ncbi:MAG: Rnase Y domain-containing protein, partial [Actinomycetota bacterium]